MLSVVSQPLSSKRGLDRHIHSNIYISVISHVSFVEMNLFLIRHLIHSYSRVEIRINPVTSRYQLPKFTFHPFIFKYSILKFPTIFQNYLSLVSRGFANRKEIMARASLY